MANHPCLQSAFKGRPTRNQSPTPLSTRLSCPNPKSDDQVRNGTVTFQKSQGLPQLHGTPPRLNSISVCVPSLTEIRGASYAELPRVRTYMSKAPHQTPPIAPDGSKPNRVESSRCRVRRRCSSCRSRWRPRRPRGAPDEKPLGAWV